MTKASEAAHTKSLWHAAENRVMSWTIGSRPSENSKHYESFDGHLKTGFGNIR